MRVGLACPCGSSWQLGALLTRTWNCARLRLQERVGYFSSNNLNIFFACTPPRTILGLSSVDAYIATTAHSVDAT
eukprot:2138754-Pyramimonas_sp.AAC.1